MNRRRMRSCHEGKRRYDSLKQAQEAIVRMVRDKARKGQPVVTFLRAYGCACGGFHYGRTREINWALVTDLAKPATLKEKL